MTQTAAAPPATGLAIRDDQDMFDGKQLAALSQLGVDGVPNAQLAVFLHQCKRTGLDPFARQLYLIGRWDNRAQATRYTIQTGIDGYRLVAHKAARRRGVDLSYDDAQWCGPDGKWTDVWLDSEPPAAAKVAVHLGQARFSAVARYDEYVVTDRKTGKPTGLWQKMPALMLSKVAEALTLRKACPQDLSGIYTSEEMDQAAMTEQRAADVTKLQAVQQKPPPAKPSTPPPAAKEEPVDAEIVPDEGPENMPADIPAEPAQAPAADPMHAWSESYGDDDRGRRATARRIAKTAGERGLTLDDVRAIVDSNPAKFAGVALEELTLDRLSSLYPLVRSAEPTL